MYTPGGCRGGRSDFKADSGRVYRAELGPPLAERRRAFRILFYPPDASALRSTTNESVSSRAMPKGELLYRDGYDADEHTRAVMHMMAVSRGKKKKVGTCVM